MLNQVFDSWSNMAKNNFRPMMEMGGMMTQMSEQMARRNMQWGCDCLGMALECQKSMAAARRPEEMMQASTAMGLKAMEKWLDNMQENAKTLMQSAEECREWCEDHMSHAAECCGAAQSMSQGMSGKSKKHG